MFPTWKRKQSRRGKAWRSSILALTEMILLEIISIDYKSNDALKGLQWGAQSLSFLFRKS
jgi:hypothetical protein